MNNDRNANKISITQAFELFWLNYINFKGTSSRSEYWWWYLWDQIIHLPIYIILFFGIMKGTQNLAGGTEFSSNAIVLMVVGMLLNTILSLAIIIPSLSLLTRRLRDAGISNPTIITLLVSDIVIAILSIVFHPLYLLLLIIGIIIFIMTLLPSHD